MLWQSIALGLCGILGRQSRRGERLNGIVLSFPAFDKRKATEEAEEKVGEL